MPASRLTPKQERFVAEYLVDLNATQAAIRAGYSEQTARQTGSENLSKPVIVAAIQAARVGQQERTEITADMVLAGLLAEAKRQGEDSSPSARVSAWNLLGKHLGMFPERHQVSGGVAIHYLLGVSREDMLGSSHGHTTNGYATVHPARGGLENGNGA